MANAGDEFMEKKKKNMNNLMNKKVKSDELGFYNIYRKVLKRKIMERVSGYFNEGYVDYKLNKIIKIEEMDKDLNSLDICFDKGILMLPKDFFNMEIVKTDDVLNLMKSYPVLEDTLVMNGLYVLGVSSKDSNEDKVIKKMIAKYLAVNNTRKGLNKIKRAQMSFVGYNELQDNIMEEISLIFGENLLYGTLDKGVNYFIEEIDRLTKKNGLGRKIVNNLVELSNLSMEENKQYVERRELDLIIDDKLLPLYNKIKDYDVVYQNAILNIIEMKDFDFSILCMIDDSINLTNIIPLNEVEIRKIRDYLSYFDTNWKRMGFLETEFPFVKSCEDDDGNLVYDYDDFTFINKFISAVDDYNDKYFSLCNLIENIWKNLQEVILYEIIPRYIKYNDICNLRGLTLNKILELSKYTTKNDVYDVSEKNKTKKIRKLIKNK